jgi:DNA primase
VRKHGAPAFADLLTTAQPLSAFFFDHYTAMVDMTTLDGRARLVDLAKPQLQSIPEGVFHDMMLEQLQTLARHRLEHVPVAAPVRPTRLRQRDAGALQQRTPLRLALAHLVQNPSLVRWVNKEQELADCDLQGMEIYRELIDFCAKHPNMTTAQLLETWRDHAAQPHLQTLATWPLHGEDKQQVHEFRDAIIGLELQWTETLIGRMQKTIDQNEQEKQVQRDLLLRRQELRQALAGSRK